MINTEIKDGCQPKAQSAECQARNRNSKLSELQT